MIDMPRESRRTVQEVHHYLLTQLNLALRRPGMYGGEIALRLYMDATAFADDREAAWREELEQLRTRECFPSTGVRGAFRLLWGDDHEGAVSSVYAEIAHRQGWLELDRTLSLAEYDEIFRTSKSWCAQDRFLSEVYTTFGPPSVLFGGTNPNFPKTLAYSTDRPEDPLICFHLWNGFASPPSSESVPVHAEPALLAIRTGGTRFTDGFTFAPEGTSRRQPSDQL
ncbi:hypothetical protein ACFFV7_33245 [Nonomuraea spiralis]|uniref:Uncharacterized protein n=1 Tax=Nonomuraea spiralis TaxID=46182 RepID=A0ABV5INI0_9ACTN|nr:hypothetical protein [Nonomuraea spiralis]GGT43814.1 hypothetical protein GCM10010176_104070 [Nonomuraea spiralis]